MSFLFPLLFVAFLGGLFVLTITKNTPIRIYPLFILSLAVPVGFSICSLLIFSAYLISPGQGPFISVIAALALATFLLVRVICNPRDNGSPEPTFQNAKQKWVHQPRLTKIAVILCFAVWIFALFNFYKLFQNVSLANIFGGWDAHFFWNVKAKFFFRNPSEWRGMFDSALSWTHQDYPLLIPGSVAWGWNWSGKELQIWPAVVAFSFLFSTALLIAWYLSSTIHATVGLLASAFFMTVGAYSFWGVSQYADVPLCFFITAAGVVLVQALRSKNTSLFCLAGWLAGCAAWTKNEGLFFMGWVILLIGFLLYIRRQKNVFWPRNLLLIGLGIAIPIAAILILKKVLAPTGDYLGSGRGLADYFHAIFMDPAKTLIILKSFPIYMFDSSSWNGLWIFFLSSIGLSLLMPKLLKDNSWVTAALSVLILLGYFIVLHTSPHNVTWQMQTALQRLLLHAGGLALLFTFEIMGRMIFPASHSEAEIN